LRELWNRVGNSTALTNTELHELIVQQDQNNQNSSSASIFDDASQVLAMSLGSQNDTAALFRERLAAIEALPIEALAQSTTALMQRMNDVEVFAYTVATPPVPLPQDLRTVAMPTFLGLTLTGIVGLSELCHQIGDVQSPGQGYWEVQTGWSVPPGSVLTPVTTLSKTADSTDTGAAYMREWDSNIVRNTAYQVTIVVSAVTAGSFRYRLFGRWSSLTVSGPGTYSEGIMAGSTAGDPVMIILPTTTARFVIQSISIRVVTTAPFIKNAPEVMGNTVTINGPLALGINPITLGTDPTNPLNLFVSDVSIRGTANVRTPGAALRIQRGEFSDTGMSLEITEGGTAGRLLDFYSGTSPPIYNAGTPATYVNAYGSLYSIAELIISDVTSGSGSSYSIEPPTGDIVKIAAHRVGVGYTMQLQCDNRAYDSHLLAGLDHLGNYTLQIEEDGMHRWGAGARTALDISLGRSSATALEVNNGTYGAYQDLRLQNLTASGALTLTGLAGVSYVDLPTQTGFPAAPTGACRLFTGTAGHLAWYDAIDSQRRSFGGTLTAARTYALPDVGMLVTGTVAQSDPGQALTNSAANVDADFTAVYTIAANWLVTGRVLRVTLDFLVVTGAAAATELFYLKLGATKVFQIAAAVNPGNSTTTTFAVTYLIMGTAAAGASVIVHVNAPGPPLPSNGSFTNVLTAPAVATNGTLTIVPGLQWSSNTTLDTLTLRHAVVEVVN
jgi:hypothetical protein